MDNRPKTRKPHSKSRNGCLPCKARHVKCDETKPVCVSCEKYSSPCEYPIPKPKSARVIPYAQPQHPPISTPSSIEASNSDYASPTPGIPNSEPVLNIGQLRLLHHFSTVTVKSLATVSEANEAFPSYIVDVAFEFPFLLHGILALAALHLARLDKERHGDYLRQAESHHDAALFRFRNDVTDIVESNFEAVFCFAFMLSPFASGVSFTTQNGPEQALDSVIHNMKLTRMVAPMVRGHYEEMLKSPIALFIPKDIQAIDWENARPSNDTKPASLQRFSQATRDLYPSDINEAYGNAVQNLQLLFELIQKSPKPPSPTMVKMWAHLVTPRFMELLSDRQPGALIIFAHYAVLLSKCERFWYVQGSAQQILSIADKLVPIEWKSWLDWPKEQIELEQSSSATV
ncbi:hypothetical protein EJ04DRAFT_171146 [Polyplosphaeria fusca]|uniref:Zn(2)-C6 fungal-type domain-containing protein n=1 Tax=Polyplosphaeria fusca TaxID=682080 RepID=A0A9P4V4M0_9PLEO|nr:hypothetical protein EJ04DRAFT_171146 [Polyplosphaeria fusca]